jgi:uncharacterized protein (TIGR03085 family)
MLLTSLETHARNWGWELGMTLTELRHRERAALCATLEVTGPDAPTLCSEWSSADIAAHLVASERGWGLPMVMVYGLRRVLPPGVIRRGMQSLRSVGDRQVQQTKRHGWDWLQRRLVAGPPLPYRLASVAPIRFVEEWIHHEDIRRANDLPLRPPSVEVDDALWNAGLFLMSFREFLPEREGLEMVLPDGRSQRLGDDTRVRLEGPPGELLLFLAGRTAAANVSIEGDEETVRTLTGGLAV